MRKFKKPVLRMTIQPNQEIKPVILPEVSDEDIVDAYNIIYFNAGAFAMNQLRKEVKRFIDQRGYSIQDILEQKF